MLCSASVNFLLRLFKGFAHFIWVIYEHTCSQLIEYSAVFDKKKMARSLHPNLPIHPISPQGTFLVSPDEKVLKGKYFADVEEWNKKTSVALKGIKIDELKNVGNFPAWFQKL